MNPVDAGPEALPRTSSPVAPAPAAAPAPDPGRRRTPTSLTMSTASSSFSTAARSRRARARPSGRSPAGTASTIPHLCYSPAPGYRPDGNCRACMVEIEGERVLAASCMRRPDAGHEGPDRERARRDLAQAGLRAAASPTSPSARPRTTRTPLSGAGPTGVGVDAEPLPGARPARRPTTSAIRRWRCSSTPASSARSASAPAARSRSTTSSAWRARGHRREDRLRLRRPDGRLAPASPAASACRPARPAR